MTCRGYDPKAVKVGKLVKIAAATILDPHKRGAFFRSYAKIAQEGLRKILSQLLLNVFKSILYGRGVEPLLITYYPYAPVSVVRFGQLLQSHE